MKRRSPPRVATWLLERLGAGRHSESLAGDLIEQYAQRRSRLWYWREVLMAILCARSTSVRTRTWVATVRIVSHLSLELSVGLGALTIIDQSRHAQDWHDMLTPTFIATMIMLVAVAGVCFGLRMWVLGSKRSHGPVKHLIEFFGVAALAAGLTWASTTHRQGSTDACRNPNIERHSLASLTRCITPPTR